MTARGVIAALAALLLAAVVVRNAAVDALVPLRAEAAARIWPGHPAVLLTRAMTQIGQAARERRPVPPGAFRQIDAAAIKDPLSPEPFLVKGVQAQLAGDSKLAERAYLAAERRDPRSLPAHYFLAEQHFRTGNAARGFAEVVSLLNLAPNGVASVAPYVADYARDRAHWRAVRDMFRKNPQVESSTLAVLAGKPGNANTVLALASPGRSTAQSAWLPVLLNSLIGSGDYAKARAVWSSVAGVASARPALLFDQSFSNPAPPPPFNWELASSTIGLAERQPGGRLHLIFYGQEDGALARQLLVLPPGAYHLSLRLLGDPTQAAPLRWSVRCAESQEAFSSAPLATVASRGWSFDVPAGCPAQWLELSGRSSDFSRQSEVTIADLQLTRGAKSG